MKHYFTTRVLLLLLLTSLALLSNELISQTTLTPIVGMELSNIQTKPYFHRIENGDIETTQDGFSYPFPFIGLRAEHGLLNDFNLHLSTSYSKKSINQLRRGFIYFQIHEIRMFNLLIGLNYEFKGLHLGLSYLRSFHFHDEEGYENINTDGLNISIGYSVQNLFFELGYREEINIYSTERYQYKPIQSYNLTLGYTVELSIDD